MVIFFDKTAGMKGLTNAPQSASNSQFELTAGAEIVYHKIKQ